MSKFQYPPKTVAILGATGTQGASVVDAFLPDASWHIRALTRNPSSSAARRLLTLSKNITLVQADTSDVDSLISAFQGCSAIFAVTDYWAPFRSTKLRAEHAVGPNPSLAMRSYAYDAEIQHGRNTADAAAIVLKQDGILTHFIFSSLPSPKKGSNGKYSGIYHFDSKAAISEYIAQSQPALSRVTSTIYIGFYVSNMLLSQLMRPIKQADGSFLVLRVCDGDAAHPFIITRQDTGPLVRALVTDNAPGKTLLAYTALISWAEMTRLWASATGKDATFREISLEELKSKFPVEGEELLSATWSAEFGWTAGEEGVLAPTDVLPDGDAWEAGGRKRIEEWMKTQDWSAVLEPKTGEVRKL